MVRASLSPTSRAFLRVTVVVFLTTVLVPGLSGARGPVAPSVPVGPTSPIEGSGHLRFVHPPATPFLPYDHGARPDASGTWYVQEGATIETLAKFNDDLTTRLTEQIVVPDSHKSTGYELNGVTSTEDWFQVIIMENWCGAGFWMDSTEFTSTNAIDFDKCLHPGSFGAGDTVTLTLNLTNTTTVCLEINDSTRNADHIDCEPQADPGATSWLVTSAASDSHGYYSGPMTETVNQSATSCPVYPGFPTAVYRWSQPTWVSQFSVWSDEFLLGGNNTACYASSSSSTAIPLGANDPATYGNDTSAGTAYGSRWDLGQNVSLLDPGFDWQVETDAHPIASVGESASATTVKPGVAVNLSIGSFVGGVGPFSGVWFLNGTPTNERVRNWTFATMADGSYQFQGYLVDHLLTTERAAPTLDISVVGPLFAGTITVTPSTRIDAGTELTLVDSAGGGVLPYSYTWIGLPAGCASTSNATLVCAPTVAGTSPVSVQITDSNGSTVTTPTVTLTVDATLGASASASNPTLEVGHSSWLNVTTSGGRSPFTFAWSSLPTGCTPANSAALRCAPVATGLSSPSVVVRDANGVNVSATIVNLSVAAALGTHVAISPMNPEVGQLVNVTAVAVGGAGGLSADWTGLPSSCGAPVTLSVSCAFPGSQAYAVFATIVDADGVAARSAETVVNILPGPQVVLSVSNGTVDAGRSTIVNASVTGGTPAYRYAWSGLPAGCTIGTPTRVACTLATAGSFNFSLTVTDAVGGVGSASANVTVVPAPGGATGSGGGVPIDTALVVIGAVALVAIAAVAIVASRRRSTRR